MCIWNQPNWFFTDQKVGRWQEPPDADGPPAATFENLDTFKDNRVVFEGVHARSVSRLPVEDHSGEAGLGKHHLPGADLLGGPQASTFDPSIKELGALHVPHSHG